MVDVERIFVVELVACFNVDKIFPNRPLVIVSLCGGWYTTPSMKFGIARVFHHQSLNGSIKMGSSTSKPDTKIFTPQAPVDFSALFLSQLENSTESDYSRAQNTEKYIQDRVAQEIKKLEAQAVKQFKDTTNSALLKDDDKPSISVPASNEKIQHLTKLMQENISLTKVEVSEEIKSTRDSVIKCLKDNEGKSLNCWDEVQKFNLLVKDL